jgi:hypothetical protein
MKVWQWFEGLIFGGRSPGTDSGVASVGDFGSAPYQPGARPSCSTDEKVGDGLFDSDSTSNFASETPMTSFSCDSTEEADLAVNPANGLPMIGGTCGVDIEGNPCGTDMHSMDSFESSAIGDEICSIDTSSCGFDDSFESCSFGSDWSD